MTLTTAAEVDTFHDWAQDLRAQRARVRTIPPLVRLWDGDWNLRGRCTTETEADFNWMLNETGTGSLTLPIDLNDKRGTYLAFWMMDEEGRGTRNVHITVDKDGARWGGRMSKATLKRDPKGDTVVVEFNHDYNELKFVQVWCNPFLPPEVQFPRVFMLAGPSIYMLKLALFLNLLRLETSLWTLPDDPLSVNGWLSGLDMHNWPILVKPGSILEDSSIWTVLSSRFKTWHDMAADTLDDAELMVECRRWLDGDPDPWPGFTPRHGALVIDIVDKSGWTSQTAQGGNIFNGLERSIAQFTDDFIDETYDLVTDAPEDSQYRVADWMGTTPANPWIIYRDGDQTGIQSSEFTRNPGTAVQVNVGGHSAPGVNEGISAAVKLSGNLIGTALSGGAFQTAGDVADTFLQPLYTDTLLAWMSVKNFLRAQHAGWSHYYEYFQSGADKAYTLSSIMVLRTGFYTTRASVSHTLQVMDCAPYLIGEGGKGHWFLGDRIGSTNKYLGSRVFVDRVRGLELAWGRGKSVTWQATIGDLKNQAEPMDRAMKMIQGIMSDLHDTGVM